MGWFDMTEQNFDDYKKAGKIAEQAITFARSKAKVGLELLDLAEGIENRIIELGGKPAFPLNLSANEQAAHYTPKINDEKIIGERDVLKIDIGVHVNGFIADCSFTVDFSGENGKLLEASKTALQNALSTARAGVKVSKIGAEIEKTIKSYGFKPVENLCGHSLSQYMVHAGVSIPNVESGNYILKEGDVFAIEPFATNGVGRIADNPAIEEIFSCPQNLKARMPQTKKVISFIESNFKTLPFAKRWIAKGLKLEASQIDFALSDLKRNNSLNSYPVLQEVGKGLVSQSETSIIVEKDGVSVIVGNF